MPYLMGSDTLQVLNSPVFFCLEKENDPATQVYFGESPLLLSAVPPMNRIHHLDDVQLANKVRQCVPGPTGEDAATLFLNLKITGRAFNDLIKEDLERIFNGDSNVMEAYFQIQGEHLHERRPSLAGAFPELITQIYSVKRASSSGDETFCRLDGPLFGEEQVDLASRSPPNLDGSPFFFVSTELLPEFIDSSVLSVSDPGALDNLSGTRLHGEMESSSVRPIPHDAFPLPENACNSSLPHLGMDNYYSPGQIMGKLDDGTPEIASHIRDENTLRETGPSIPGGKVLSSPDPSIIYDTNWTPGTLWSTPRHEVQPEELQDPSIHPTPSGFHVDQISSNSPHNVLKADDMILLTKDHEQLVTGAPAEHSSYSPHGTPFLSSTLRGPMSVSTPSSPLHQPEEPLYLAPAEYSPAAEGLGDCILKNLNDNDFRLPTPESPVLSTLWLALDRSSPEQTSQLSSPINASGDILLPCVTPAMGDTLARHAQETFDYPLGGSSSFMTDNEDVEITRAESPVIPIDMTRRSEIPGSTCSLFLYDINYAQEDGSVPSNANESGEELPNYLSPLSFTPTLTSSLEEDSRFPPRATLEPHRHLEHIHSDSTGLDADILTEMNIYHMPSDDVTLFRQSQPYPTRNLYHPIDVSPEMHGFRSGANGTVLSAHLLELNFPEISLAEELSKLSSHFPDTQLAQKDHFRKHAEVTSLNYTSRSPAGNTRSDGQRTLWPTIGGLHRSNVAPRHHVGHPALTLQRLVPKSGSATGTHDLVAPRGDLKQGKLKAPLGDKQEDKPHVARGVDNASPIEGNTSLWAKIKQMFLIEVHTALEPSPQPSGRFQDEIGHRFLIQSWDYPVGLSQTWPFSPYGSIIFTDKFIPSYILTE